MTVLHLRISMIFAIRWSTTSTKLLKTSQQLDRAGLADLLGVLADRVRGGTVLLESGGESLTLELPDRLVVDLEVEQGQKTRGTKMELEIEIEWYEGADVQSGVTLPEPDGA